MHSKWSRIPFSYQRMSSTVSIEFLFLKSQTNRIIQSLRTCLGRREALQVCPEVSTDKSIRNPSMTTMYNLYEQYCPVSIRRSANEYAQSICRKYQAKFSSLLSGNGQQLNYGCIVACEDRLWPDVHYQMDAFTDGRFPFGTDCSTNDRRGYCLNGKCIHFDKADISYDTAGKYLKTKIFRTKFICIKIY